MFDVEYWSLEQAKLGKSAEKPLARQVAVVTGGGSGIGAATAKHWREPARKWRCSTAISTLPRWPWRRASAATALAIACDVTDPTMCARHSTR